MCVVHQKSVNKLDLTWKQSFRIPALVSEQMTNERHFISDSRNDVRSVVVRL